MKFNKQILQSNWFFALMLAVLLTLAYALLAPTLGFSWDGWPFAWISETYGNEGLTRYFSTNRPVWGLLYKITTPIIGSNALGWQIFSLAARWLCGLALFAFLNKLWPKQKQLNGWITFLFSVYPGFGQHSNGIVYGHFYLVLALVFISLWSMLKAFEKPKRAWLYVLLSLTSAAYSIFSTEYFFGLELLRPLLLWMVVCQNTPGLKDQLIQIIKRWWPYAVILAGYLFWRIFILSFHLYTPTLAAEPSQPLLSKLLQLAETAMIDIFEAGILAWFVPLSYFTELNLQSNTAMLNLALIGVGAFLVGLYYILRGQQRTPKKFDGAETALLGALSLLVCGLPVWVAGLEFGFNFPSDRLSLPMMLSSSMLIGGLVFLLIRRPKARIVVLALLVGIGTAAQFFHSTQFRQEWKYQQSFFQQLTWRAPYIEPGTTLITKEIEQFYSTDNSLTAPLNWIYAPGNNSLEMDYLLAYINLRTSEGRSLENLSPNQDISQDYLAARFSGSTDQVLVLYYSPPGCLRIMSPLYDQVYPMLDDEIENYLYLSQPEKLIKTLPAVQLPEELFSIGDNTNIWCYYFQKADLARQMGDWETAAALGDKAFKLDDSPNHASERLPFVEAYAMTGSLNKAIEQTNIMLKINPYTDEMLCSVWQRVSEHKSNDKVNAMIEVTCGE